MSIIVTSMTGFARAGGRSEIPIPISWTWEAKSVNSKGLDIRVRLPHGFDALEVSVRSAATRVFTRGALTLALSVSSDSEDEGAGINETALDALIQIALQKAEQLGPKMIGVTIAPARLDGLIAMAQGRGQTGVLDPEVAAGRDSVLMAGLDEALEVLALVRRQEGKELAGAVSSHLDAIARLCDEGGQLAALQPEALKARLLDQVRELMSASPPLSEEKLAQEAALLAVKYDIREELDRLSAHVAQARELLTIGEPCGRRLDFLCQEFNREANTLCSKSPDTVLTRIGLDLKSSIDQLREQIQNIE